MDSLRAKLRDYNQEHLLKFWDQLTEEQRVELQQDLSKLDLTEVTSYYQKAVEGFTAHSCTLDDKVSPIPKDKIASARTSTPEEIEAYEKLGLQAIADGHVAVLLLAGGQGTRLGVSYPKGMYNVGLPSGKTLFQLQAQRIYRLQQLAETKCKKKGYITWYILTSEATHEATLSFLKENDYFGLEESNVKAFKQGMLPCFTLDGKIILDEKHKISRAPDGNGGLYRALKVQGILDDMIERGISSVHAHSVDNILIKVADPIFLGYCLSSETDCGVKVVEKVSPQEAVGVVCKVDETYQVVEYSEITAKTAELRNEDGGLTYNAANICNHYFTVDFLYSVGNVYDNEMELHAAKKKIPYVDDDGNRCTPDKPNGIKIEKFVFDVFKFSKNLIVWEGVREEDFSPLKNSDAAGQDCPSTAKRDVFNLHKKWLLKAGAKKVVNGVEVSPLISYAGENLEHVKGLSFEGPCVLE